MAIVEDEIQNGSEGENEIEVVVEEDDGDQDPDSDIGGRAHSPPGVKWLLEPIDIYNVNAPPTLRYSV